MGTGHLFRGRIASKVCGRRSCARPSARRKRSSRTWLWCAGPGTRPVGGLGEWSGGPRAVFGLGSARGRRLTPARLIVGDVLGTIPADTPQVALQQDLEKEQRRLRLQPDPEKKILDLDLRKPND